MKAIILCGGQGTRLREETEHRPKPMVEVGGRPILWHIMKYYAHFDVREFVIGLGYRGSMIKDYFLNYEAMNRDFTVSLGRLSAIDYHAEHEEQDFRVTLADTGLDTMTGARVQRLRRYVGRQRFLVTYGDGLTDLDLDAALRFHESHGRIATVTTVRPTSRFGMLEIDDDGRVNRFRDDCILEREPMERLAAAGELAAYRHDGFFYAMGTYREYLQLNELSAAGAAPWVHPRTSERTAARRLFHNDLPVYASRRELWFARHGVPPAASMSGRFCRVTSPVSITGVVS